MEYGSEIAYNVPPNGTKRHWAPAIQSRKILEEYDIDINEMANGIYLLRGGPFAPRFGGTQTGVYHQKVLEALQQRLEECVKKNLDKEQTASWLKQRLVRIGRDYVNIEFTDGSYDTNFELPR